MKSSQRASAEISPKCVLLPQLEPSFSWVLEPRDLCELIVLDSASPWEAGCCLIKCVRLMVTGTAPGLILRVLHKRLLDEVLVNEE